MHPYEALYGRRCRFHIGWFEVGNPLLLGPNFIYKTWKKVLIIRNQLKKAYSQRNSYANHRRRDLEFKEGVFEKFTYEKGGHIWKERELESSLYGSL